MNFRNCIAILILFLSLGLSGCAARIIILHDPLSAEAHNDLGVQYLRENQWRAAERAFHRALRKRPNWLYPYLNLGYLYSRTSQWEKAAEFYYRALRAAKGHCADCWNNLAYARFMSGSDAVRLVGWVKIALRQSSVPQASYYHTGAKLAFAAGDCKKAIQWARNAVIASLPSELPRMLQLYSSVVSSCGRKY